MSESVFALMKWIEDVQELDPTLSAPQSALGGVKVLKLPDLIADTIGFYTLDQEWFLAFQEKEWAWVRALDSFVVTRNKNTSNGIVLYKKGGFFVDDICTSIKFFLPFSIEKGQIFPLLPKLRMHQFGKHSAVHQKTLRLDKTFTCPEELWQKNSENHPLLFVDSFKHGE